MTNIELRVFLVNKMLRQTLSKQILNKKTDFCGKNNNESIFVVALIAT